MRSAAVPGLDSLWSAVRAALDMPDSKRERLLQASRDTVARHTLEAERERFQTILSDVDRLWRMDEQVAAVLTGTVVKMARGGPARGEARHD